MNFSLDYEFKLKKIMESIKKKIARQYINHRNITVGKAFHNIESRIEGNKEIISDAITRLRLREQGDDTLDKYFPITTLRRYTGLKYI